MPQARDEAGNVWETDAEGNAVRLLTPAPSSAPIGIGVDPYKASENARQDRSLGLTAADKSADNARADRKEQREVIEFASKFNPDGTPKASAMSEAQVKSRENANTKLTSAARLAGQLGRMKELYNNSFKGQGFSSIKEWLPTADGQRFKAVAESMRATIKPLIRGPSEGTFTEGDQNLLDSLIPQPGAFDAGNVERFGQIDAMIRDQIDLHGPQAGADIQKLTARKLREVNPNPTPPEGPNDNVEVATGETRTEVTRGPVEKRIKQMLDGGVSKFSAATIKQYAKANGYDPGKLTGALAHRALNGVPKGGYDVLSERVVPVTPLNRVMASPAATIATQAANAFTMGGLDEIGGAARSLVTGEPLADTIAAANYNKQMQAQQNPGSALAGNIMGGAAGMLTGGAALRGMGFGRGAWATANPIKTAMAGDAAYGAGYGAGENNENRVIGAAIGAPAALAGSALGAGAMNVGGRMLRGAITPDTALLRGANVPLTVGQVLGGAVKKTEDALTSVPFLGSVVENRHREGVQAVADRMANDAVAPINGTASGYGPDAVDNLLTQGSNAYDNATAGVSVPLDAQFGADVAQTQALGGLLPDDLSARFDKALQNRVAPIVSDTYMTGPTFQQGVRGLKSYRAETTKPGFEQDYRDALTGGIDALRSQMNRGGGAQVVADLDAADQAWKRIKVVQKATEAARNGARSGEVGLPMPSQFNDAAYAAAKKYGGPRFNGELLDAAQRLLPSSTPDSGSAGRAMVGLGLASAGGGGVGYSAEGGLGAGVGALAPAGILAALGTRGGQAVLTAALLRRIAPFKKAGNAMVDYAPVGGALGASATLPFIGQ